MNLTQIFRCNNLLDRGKSGSCRIGGRNLSDSNDKKAHPLVEKAFNLAKLDSSLAPPYMEELASSIFFDDEAIKELKEALANYFHTEELITAVLALLDLARVLDELDHKDAALSILMIVATAEKPLKAFVGHKFQQYPHEDTVNNNE